MKGKKGKQSSSILHVDITSSNGDSSSNNDDNSDDQPKHISGAPNSSSFRETDRWHGNKGGVGKARNTAIDMDAAEENNQQDEHDTGSNRRARSGRLQARKATAAAAGAGNGTGACDTTILSANSSSNSDGDDEGDASYEESEEEMADIDAADRVGAVQTKGHGGRRSASRRSGASSSSSAQTGGDGRSRRSGTARTKDSNKKKSDNKPCHTPKNEREDRPVALQKNAPSTRSGKQLTRRLCAATAASSEDDDDCLKDSSSDGTVSDSNGGGGGGGGEGSVNEPVLCRCGAQHWRDGKRWIRCDGRGCWTWEHFRCAYPVAEGANKEVEEGGGEENLPAVHLCQRCKAKGSAGAVRSLARGDGISTKNAFSSSSSSAGGTGKSKEDAGEVGGALVRRSSRQVEGRERRVMPMFQRRKHVIGEADPVSFTSDEEEEGGDFGFGAVGGGGGGIGGGSDESDSEFFLAPEGNVEAAHEFRCRCGSTREGERVRGGNSGGDEDDGAFCDGDGRWVQCRSDSCGVWEHAACCDYGCSSREDRGARGSSTQVERRRTRRVRHWCRGCDPKGAKHAKSEEKRRNRDKVRAEKKGGREGGGRGGAARGKGGMSVTQDLETVRRRGQTALEEKVGLLRSRLWRAVANGDAALAGQIFREAEGATKSEDEEHSDLVVHRLLEAEPPPLVGCLDLTTTTVSLDGGGGGAMGSDGVGSRAFVFPPGGVTLLMFAAGYWSLHCCGAAVATTSVSAVQANSRETEARGHLRASVVVEGTESAEEDRGTVSSAGPTVTTGRTPDNARFEAGGGESEARATTEEDRVLATPTTTGAEQDSGASTKEVHVPAARETPSGASESTVPGLSSESRLAVIREVLGRGGDRAVLGVDGEGRTAAHHAAAAGGVLEVALLLEGEPGREAALARVRLFFGAAVIIGGTTTAALVAIAGVFILLCCAVSYH